VKILLGVLLLINAALLMWGAGQRQFVNDPNSPAAEFHPELMELLPPEKSRSLAKVTLNPGAEAIISTTTETVDNAADKGVDSATQPFLFLSDEAKEEKSLTAANMLPVAVAGQCMLIGPYKTAIERGRGGRKLNDMKIKYSDRMDPEGRVLGYRVFQGPFASKAAVSRAKRRLKKQGVKDLYLVKEGEKKQFLSLGFFSSENSANSFIGNFSKQKIKTRKRVEYGANYWLLVSDLKSIWKLAEKRSVPIQRGAAKNIKNCSDIPW